MGTLKVLYYQLSTVISHRNKGFGVTTLVAILITMTGIQAWQFYNYKEQMETYISVTQNYKLNVIENDIKILILNGSTEREFKIKGVVASISEGKIIFKLNDGQKIRRNFITPSDLMP